MVSVERKTYERTSFSAKNITVKEHFSESAWQQKTKSPSHSHPHRVSLIYISRKGFSLIFFFSYLYFTQRFSLIFFFAYFLFLLFSFSLIYISRKGFSLIFFFSYLYFTQRFSLIFFFRLFSFSLIFFFSYLYFTQRFFAYFFCCFLFAENSSLKWLSLICTHNLLQSKENFFFVVLLCDGL